MQTAFHFTAGPVLSRKLYGEPSSWPPLPVPSPLAPPSSPLLSRAIVIRSAATLELTLNRSCSPLDPVTSVAVISDQLLRPLPQVAQLFRPTTPRTPRTWRRHRSIRADNKHLQLRQPQQSLPRQPFRTAPTIWLKLQPATIIVNIPAGSDPLHLVVAVLVDLD